MKVAEAVGLDRRRDCRVPQAAAPLHRVRGGGGRERVGALPGRGAPRRHHRHPLPHAVRRPGQRARHPHGQVRQAGAEPVTRLLQVTQKHDRPDRGLQAVAGRVRRAAAEAGRRIPPLALARLKIYTIF